MVQPDIGGLYLMGFDRMVGTGTEMLLDHTLAGYLYDGSNYDLYFLRTRRFAVGIYPFAGIGRLHLRRSDCLPGLSFVVKRTFCP